MKTVTLVLTNEEAKELASLISRKVGMIQYQATQTRFNGRDVSNERRSELDESFSFWNRIARKIAGSFGYEAWMQPSAYASEEADMEVEKKLLETTLSRKA